MSIRAQIFFAVTAISLLTISAFAAVVTRRVQARANQLAHEAAAENAHFVAQVATRGLDQSKASFDAALGALKQTGWMIKLGGNGQATRLQLFDATAKLRFDSGRIDADSAPGPDVEAALSGTPRTTPVLLAGSRVAAAEPLRRSDGELLGAVRVIRPVVGVEEILGGLAPEIAGLGFGAVLLAMISAILVGRTISAPISQLTAAARRIADGDRSHPLPLPRGSEVRALTSAYAEMRRELEDKRQIERLSQDLSHELKNPIASVRALTEALEDGALADAEAGPRLVAQIRGAASRMERILSDLLALSRLEWRGLEHPTLVDPRALLGEAIEALAARAAQLGARVEVDAPPLPAIRADAVWLTRALENLVSNALEHCGPGEAVTVSARLDGDRLELKIANPGELPAAVRDRLFERFVSRRPGGTGLGMAIARGVAVAHGGTLSLLEPGPPKVVLCLRLPG